MNNFYNILLVILVIHNNLISYYYYIKIYITALYYTKYINI